MLEEGRQAGREAPPPLPPEARPALGETMSYWACCRRAGVGAGAWPGCFGPILLCPDFLCDLSSVSHIPTFQL